MPANRPAVRMAHTPVVRARGNSHAGESSSSVSRISSPNSELKPKRSFLLTNNENQQQNLD